MLKYTASFVLKNSVYNNLMPLRYIKITVKQNKIQINLIMKQFSVKFVTKFIQLKIITNTNHTVNNVKICINHK